MVKIRLVGKIPFLEMTRGHKPEHFFLPRPSRLRSDLDSLDLLSVTEGDIDLKWEAVWYGDRLCKRVLIRSNKHLEYHNKIDLIYRKLSRINKSDHVRRDELSALMKENSELISRWDNIVQDISSQLGSHFSP